MARQNKITKLTVTLQEKITQIERLTNATRILKVRKFEAV